MGNEITVVGCGMSGLIAAIDLVRNGYEARVLERESGYGGASIYNPSVHATPLDVKATSDYIGIDLRSVFHPMRMNRQLIHETAISMPTEGSYFVERGDRPSSLDTLLYETAVREGVRFEFGTNVSAEDLKNLPDNTIIATGLYHHMYDALDIPYIKWEAYTSRGEIALRNYAFIWMDECITEYGYFSSVNGIYFNLLFSTRPVTKDCLKKYEDMMIRVEGIEHREWDHIKGVVPIASPGNPRLRSGRFILSGTISGSMDPMLWFGISGALVSGKTAAMAVYDPQRAQNDFSRFNALFEKAYRNKTGYFYPMRKRVGVLEKLVQTIGPERVSKAIWNNSHILKGAVPGFMPAVLGG